MSTLSFLQMSRRALLFLLAAAGLAACTEGPEPDLDEDDVGEDLEVVGDLTGQPALVAVIESDFGRDTLTTEDFDSYMQRVQQVYPQMVFDQAQAQMIRAEIINQFVNEHLIAGEARRRGLTVDSAAVEAQLEMIRQQMPGDSAIAAVLGDLTDAEIREEIIQQMLPGQLFQAVQEETTPPTEEDVIAFQTEISDVVRAQHILLPVERSADPETVDSVRSLAETLLDSLEQGADFADLARRYSQDPGSAPQGGELGYFRRGQMVDPFDEAVFALADSGDVTPEPIRTDFGYHIIRLVDRRQDEVPIEQARSALTQRRQQEAQQELFEALRADATVHVNPSIVDPALLRTDG